MHKEIRHFDQKKNKKQLTFQTIASPISKFLVFQYVISTPPPWSKKLFCFSQSENQHSKIFPTPSFCLFLSPTVWLTLVIFYQKISVIRFFFSFWGVHWHIFFLTKVWGYSLLLISIPEPFGLLFFSFFF